MPSKVAAVSDSTLPCTSKAQQEYISTTHLFCEPSLYIVLSGQSTKLYFGPTSSVMKIALEAWSPGLHVQVCHGHLICAGEGLRIADCVTFSCWSCPPQHHLSFQGGWLFCGLWVPSVQTLTGLCLAQVHFLFASVWHLHRATTMFVYIHRLHNLVGRLHKTAAFVQCQQA